MNALCPALLLVAGVSTAPVMGQVTHITLALEVEGNPQPLVDFVGTLVVGTDTLLARGPVPVFDVPNRLYGQKGTVSVTCGSTALRFAVVPVTWNRLVPHWTFGVDQVPFDRQRVWRKAPSRARTYYFLDNSIGFTYSYFN